MNRDTIAQFAVLFEGRYDAVGLEQGGVARKQVVTDDYLYHLNGITGLGVFPLRDDGTVRFASIDIDKPDSELAWKLATMLPGKAFVERSLSGNYHIHVFFREDCEAWAARGVLKAALDVCGEPHVEVFPKAESLLPGMVGSYLRLPYFGDSRPVLDVFGAEMSLEAFVAAAMETRQRAGVWEMRARAAGAAPRAERRTEDARVFGADTYLHECAEHIIQGALSGDRPIISGHRSAVFFHLSKMLLTWEQMDQDDAWHTIREVADASPDPLPARELSRIFQNAASGRWTSWGCDDPLMAPYVSPTCGVARG